MTQSGYGRTVFAILALLLAPAALAGITVYEDGDKKLEVGGRIQFQYLSIDPDDGDSVDELFFRRLRPYVAGSVTKNWSGKIQFDFGESIDQNEVAVKDAYMRYTGYKNTEITIGNVKPGFSREFMTSSKYQQLVARGFAGDHNFGSPDRAMVVKYDGYTGGKKVNWSAAAGIAQHDPSAERMDFDSVVVNQSDFNEGPLLVGRVDIHPLGPATFKRGDFERGDAKFNLSAATFTWSNDDDVNTYTDDAGNGIDPDKADLDSADGVEISAGFRGLGISADVEYQMISGETVDPTFTGGLYVDGETELDILGVDAGYMIIESRLEVAVGWDSLDADGYPDPWERTTIGINTFVNKHNLKLQVNYFEDENFLGIPDNDTSSVQAQAQFVF